LLPAKLQRGDGLSFGLVEDILIKAAFDFGISMAFILEFNNI